MTIAPVINVADEERRRNSQLCDAIELVLANVLTVFDPVPRVRSRVLALRLPKGIKDVVDGRGAVAVDGDLVSGPMCFLHHLRESFAAAPWVRPIARVPLEWDVIWLRQVACVSLNRAIVTISSCRVAAWVHRFPVGAQQPQWPTTRQDRTLMSLRQSRT